MIPLFHKHCILVLLALVVLSGVAAGPAPAAEPTGAAEQYRVSAFHYSRGDWNEAVEAFDRFLADHPNHPQAVNVHFFRGESLVQLSRHEEAVRAYTLFLSQAPQHTQAPHAEFRLAECYYLSGSTQAAAQAFADFQKKRPDSKLIDHAWSYLAEIAAKEARWEEAVQHYQKAIDAAPTPSVVVEARLGQARAYGHLQKWPEACRGYRKLLADLKASDGPSSDSSSLSAGNVALEAGIAEYRRGSFRRAVACFEQAAQWEPKLAAQADFWIAKTHFQVRDWPRALEPLVRLRKSQKLPDFQDEIHYLTAKIHLEQGEADLALSLLEYQRKTWPTSPWTDESLHLLVTLHLESGDTDAARAAFDRLRELDEAAPLAARAQLALAAHLQRESAHEPALAILEQELAGETPAELVERRDYLKAVSLLALGRLEDAEQTLDPIGETSPGHVQMLQGLIHTQRQAWAEAAAAYQAAIDNLTTSEQKALAQLRGVTPLLHLGRIDEARALWRSVDRNALPREQYLTELSQIAGVAYRAKQLAWASQLYEELAKDDNPPRFVEQGLAGLAWCRMGSSAAEANEVLDQLLAKNPGSPLAVGALYQQAQQAEESNPDLAISRYRQLVENHASDPLAPHAQLRLAVLLDQRGEDAEAEKLLVPLTNNPPQDLPADDLWYRLAWVRLDQGQEETALAAFRHIHAEHPQSELWPDATYRLAEDAVRAGKTDEARALLTQLLDAKSPTKVTQFGRYMLGQIEIQAGNWEAAQKLMDEVAANLADQPLQATATFWGAEARFRLAKFDEAEARFEQMLTQSLGRSLPSQPVAEMRLAQISAHQNDWQAAYERAEAIGKKYPDFNQTHELDYLRGRCLARLGKFDDARSAYAQVVESEAAADTETAAMAQWMIGETYFHQKNYEAAIRAYAQVGATHDKFPKWQAAALLQIGKCHEIQESWKKATQYYTEVQTQFRETPFAPEAETRLSVVRQRTEQAQIDSTRKQ